jgi:hypothetical protein
VVILENRCREGGQTPEDTLYLVAPLADTGVVVDERYKDAPDDCRTVSKFSTAVELSSAQIRGYLSLVNGTTRVQAYSLDPDTPDGILLFNFYMEHLDEHRVEVERRLPALRAFPSKTWKPYVGWSAHLVRKAMADAYWEALLEPEHLAGGQWPALERAVEAIRVYFEKLADSIHRIERQEGVPKADVEALAQFAADEKAFWQGLLHIETVDREWLRRIEDLRAKVMEYYP